MQWMPVSEMLPKEGDIVLVTLKIDWSYGKGTDIETQIDIATYYGEDGFGMFCDWNEGQTVEVVAWMPLPEPYKE